MKLIEETRSLNRNTPNRKIFTREFDKLRFSHLIRQIFYTFLHSVRKHFDNDALESKMDSNKFYNVTNSLLLWIRCAFNFEDSCFSRWTLPILITRVTELCRWLKDQSSTQMTRIQKLDSDWNQMKKLKFKTQTVNSENCNTLNWLSN